MTGRTRCYLTHAPSPITSITCCVPRWRRYCGVVQSACLAVAHWPPCPIVPLCKHATSGSSACHYSFSTAFGSIHAKPRVLLQYLGARARSHPWDLMGDRSKYPTNCRSQRLFSTTVIYVLAQVAPSSGIFKVHIHTHTLHPLLSLPPPFFSPVLY